MKRVNVILVGVAAIFLGGAAGAEVLSFSSGIDLDDPTQLSADAGISIGDVDTRGVRVNYRLSPEILVFGGLASADVSSETDIAFGGGLIYTLKGDELPFRSGIKASFYRWSGSYRSFADDTLEVDINELTIRYVMSGDIETVENVKWFGEIGFHMFNSSSSYSASVDPAFRRSTVSWSDTKLGLELGALYEFNKEFSGILSLEMVDKTFINLALRYRF